jgi:signal transduction histidine kinase
LPADFLVIGRDAMPSEQILGSDERQRFEAQSAEIATLAGGLAHEIRNPLSTISLNLDLMAQDLDSSETPRERRLLGKVQFIQRECRQRERILSDFLQFARVGALELEPGDLNALVRAFIGFFQPQAADHGIEISPHLAADLPPVAVNHDLFRQALLNLALNAQQAMPDGGTLELQTYVSGHGVCLELIDTGVGMDAATRERMFRPFYSRRKGGSGLGLPMVRRIVEAHHGTIDCESEPGRGTRFRLCFPAATP